MRCAEVNATIRAVPPEGVYQAVCRFDQYPELAPHVESAVVHRSLPDSTGESSWELRFRSGLLRWTEQERFLSENLRIEFAQIHGDFDHFTGHWALSLNGPDTDLHFEANFDFGIPSLEGILDPIAERVIRETIAWVLVGMFEDVQIQDRDLSAAPATSTATEV